MRLIWQPGEDDYRLVANGRTDSEDPIVRSGETFEVEDRDGRFLLARYYPQIQPASAPHH